MVLDSVLKRWLSLWVLIVPNKIVNYVCNICCLSKVRIWIWIKIYGKKRSVRKVSWGWVRHNIFCKKEDLHFCYLCIFAHARAWKCIGKKKNSKVLPEGCGEGWCLSYQQKDQHLEKVKNACQACLMCWISMKILLGSQSMHSLTGELTGDAWKQNNCRLDATNCINKMAYLKPLCFDYSAWMSAGKGICKV